MRISDWSSDVCSSDLRNATKTLAAQLRYTRAAAIHTGEPKVLALDVDAAHWHPGRREGDLPGKPTLDVLTAAQEQVQSGEARFRFFPDGPATGGRSEERRVGNECGSTCRSRRQPYP